MFSVFKYVFNVVTALIIIYLESVLSDWWFSVRNSLKSEYSSSICRGLVRTPEYAAFDGHRRPGTSHLRQTRPQRTQHHHER